MRYFVIPLLIFLCACNNKELKIDGAYTLVAAKYGDSALSKEEIAKHKTLKICSNGYWISATVFGNPKITVESASGGTYILKNGKYIETVNFDSRNDSGAGKTYDFDYKLQGDKYTRKGMMSNDKCSSCFINEEYHKMEMGRELSDKSLEGVWKLQMSEWFGKKVDDADFFQFKIYCYPYFAWAQYHSKGKDFIGVAGGTYRIDGLKLVEHVEYFSFYDIIPYDFEIDLTKFPSGTIQEVSMNGGGKEIWKKIQ